jgi:hypothetical protein
MKGPEKKEEEIKLFKRRGLRCPKSLFHKLSEIVSGTIQAPACLFDED